MDRYEGDGLSETNWNSEEFAVTREDIKYDMVFICVLLLTVIF